MLRTLASYFLGENEADNVPTDSSERSVEVIIARELNDEPEDGENEEDDWVLVDESDEELDDDVGLHHNKHSQVLEPSLLVRSKVNFVLEEPEIKARGTDNNNFTKSATTSINGSTLGELAATSTAGGASAEAIQPQVQLPEEDDENGLMDTDFAWENSLIEHPSVYIASQQQRRYELEEEKRMMLMKKPKRKSGRRRLGRVGRQQQNGLAAAVATALIPEAAEPGTGLSGSVSGVPQEGVEEIVSRTAARAPTHSHASPGAMEFLDVLKLQQQQQLLEQQHRGSGKRKHCIRDSRVHQSVCNKPQRRSDKQNYTRTSRVNNDRKSNYYC